MPGGWGSLAALQAAGDRLHACAQLTHRRRRPLPPPCRARLAREVQLRLLGTGMGLPTGDPEPTSVDRYLAKLKDAALHSRALHAQFAADTKAAVSKRDIEDAVGRCAVLGGRVAG